MLLPHEQGFEKAALFRSSTMTNTSSNTGSGAGSKAGAGGFDLSAVLLDKSGIVHIARAPILSNKASGADVDAGKGTDVAHGSSPWLKFADTMIDMCVLDQKHLISEQVMAQDTPAPRSTMNNSKSDSFVFPSMSVSPLLGEIDSATALLLSFKSNSNSLFQSNNAMIWLPLAKDADIPQTLQQSQGGLVLHLPSASVGHMLQPLGMCVHQGILLNCQQKGSLNAFSSSVNSSSSGSGSGSGGEKSEYGHRGSFARAVIAGLPAGILNVTCTPIAATILLLLARCRTASAVALGKSVLRALFRNPSSIAATADVLEEVLLELLRRKESKIKSETQHLPGSYSKGTDISSGSSSSAETSRTVVGRRGPTIDAESSTVAAIVAIASWPERLFGLVANKSTLPTSPQRALTPAYNANATINKREFQVQVDSLIGLTYAVMLQFVFAVDPLLFFELTSHLGRKVEPETAKGLLPLALQSPYGPAILRSPLSLFEECIRQGLLTYASRYLTLACEYVGGSSSFHSSLECLSMAQELVMALLLCMRLPLAIECLEFCDRLESIIESLVTEENRKRQARRSAREREREPSASDTNTTSCSNASNSSTAVVNRNLTTASHSFGERIYRHWLRVSPTLSHYLGGGALWSAFSELDEHLHAERVRGNSSPISNTSAVANINATNNANSSAGSNSNSDSSSGNDSGGNTSKYAVFLAVKKYLGAARFDEILGLSLKTEARVPACIGTSFSSALIAMLCEQLLAARKTYMCGMTVLALLSSDKVKRHMKGHLLGRGRFNTAATNTSIKSISTNNAGDDVLTSAWHLLQRGKIDQKEYELLLKSEENKNQERQGQGQRRGQETFQRITNTTDAGVEARLAILRIEGEHELYAFESHALAFALFILQSYGFIPSPEHAGQSPEEPLRKLSSPKCRLDSTMGYVFIKQQCGLEANVGVRAQNTKHFHELGLPERCFRAGCSEISYAQIMRSIILACVMSNKLGTAAILACVAGLPFTAAAIAELDVETTTLAYALSIVSAVLVDAPCCSLRQTLCTTDTSLLESAQNAASEDDATPAQTIHLKMLCVGLGLRDACMTVKSANDVAHASYAYFAEHCKHLVV